MKFFWFERSDTFELKNLSEDLEKNGFDGVLLIYSFYSDDHFVKIANSIDVNKKIKYIVAIRPYAISPQYLCMINNSFKKISKNRIIINIVTGWIYDQDKTVGGIQGVVNDLSSNIERSNYLIDYVKTLNSVSGGPPEFYVSVTNETVFNSVSKNNVIVPYSLYKQNRFNLDKNKTMISIFPIIRETEEELFDLKKVKRQQDVEYFTKKEFEKFLHDLESDGIFNILLGNDHDEESKKNIISFVSSITNK